MANINETAAEVAEALLNQRGGYDGFDDLRTRDLEIAHDAAVRMSQRLGKSVDAEVLLDKTLEFTTRAAAIGQGHMQVIVLAGYAAFFALWSTMAPAIPTKAMLGTGALMIVSVITFIGWTIAGLVLTKVTTERTMLVYRDGPVDFLDRIRDADAKNFSERHRLMRWWKPVVGVAGGTALLASAILGGEASLTFVTKVLDERTKAAENCPALPKG